MHSGSSAATPRGTPSRRGKSPRFSTDNLSQAGTSTLSSNFPNKPLATFFSCIDIPVVGAVSLDDNSSKDSAEADPDLTKPAESKRAPRKSKTDALAALNNQARSSSMGPEDVETIDSLTQKYRNGPPVPAPSILDLSTVKTANPRHRITHSTPRPFGLQDCPEFYPTLEEFKDPMAYVKKISDQAKEFGICKIIPPAEWKMPFVTDTETFRFKTRLQRLNSIEASSRAKLNFLEQLYRFHKQQGNPRVVVPTINHKPLDLWLLRKEVQKMGGYDAVSKGRKWSDLGRILGYGGIPGLSTQIRNSYTRVILPYEHFCDRVRNSPALSPIIARDSYLKTHTNMQIPGHSRSNAVTPAGDTSPPGSPLTATSSPLSEPPDESEANGKASSSRPRRSTRMSSELSTSSKKPLSGTLLQSPVIPSPVFYDKQQADSKVGTPEVRNPVQASGAKPMTNAQQMCEICHKKHRGEEMLLCDGCDCGFHMFCLDPPLEAIPKEQWFCFTCLSGTGGDFGFDEGEEHSLSSFQARDLVFRRLWFESHPPVKSGDKDLPDIMINKFGNLSISEYDMEEEFWRLVQSPHETVEIEYGADVHSTTHGSAMPTMETHPLDSYSKDPWNLNNIPILPDSLLRFIKSDISGMTVPWTYVGMAFSTFCWHNEDHYTYSINFMHWGETKTWYGIPGDDAEKFEAAIKGEAPDLFEAQPDLLFQLVTLMNPQRVTEAGVRVYACNQRAGEFVITFPKAYHAGFNHGLNFNEAVNFALPDWLPYDRDCVHRYRQHRKLPVFSHDELLITITQQSQSISTAMWLIDSLKEMTEREIKNREKSRSLGFAEILEEEDRPEDQYQCLVCKSFCYLSQITCPCSTKVVCVEHADLLCDNRSPHLTLRKRFSDEELLDTQAKVAERAGIPSAWRGKLNKILLESARPPLRSLRALLAEGERINYKLDGLTNLRKCVTKANEWVDSANSFIIRKQSRKRSRKRGRPSAADLAMQAAEDPGDRPDRGLDDLYALLREVESLGFDCPEIGVLRTLAQQAEETKVKASALLEKLPSEEEREDYLQDCKRLLLQGSSLNVLLDELIEVEKIVDREQLVQELEEKLDDTDAVLTLEEVRQLLTRARTCNLSADNKHMQLLEARQQEGNDWEDKAKSILDQSIKTIAELDDFANLDASVPINPTVADRLLAARSKAKDFEKQAIAWLNPPSDGGKPRVQDVQRLVTRAEKDFSINAIKDLKSIAEIATDLENRCDQVLRNRFVPIEGEDVFVTITQWRDYAKDHLKIFSLPSFDKLEAQIKLHSQWINDLPWYCEEHNEPHSQAILEDVVFCTRTEDEFPPSDEYFTCICNSPVRPPPPGIVSDAVQCDHCYARFHGECAKNGGSCPFCDHHHWNGTIHKERRWHFCYMPTILAKAPEITKNYSVDYKQLQDIILRVDRLSTSIGQFLMFTSQPVNQRAEYIPQVRHYMRKLYKIQFTVSPNPEVSYGLDLAGLHRILAGRPPLLKPRKRRRPRFTFGQDIDSDWTDGTRCICRGRTNYLANYPTIRCESCTKLYHAGCVFYPAEQAPNDKRPFICPLCCLRKGKVYPFSDVRVKPSNDDRQESDVYIHTQEMLKQYSKEIVYRRLPQPCKETLFVELVQFTPGTPEESTMSNGSSSRPPAHSNSHLSHVSSSQVASTSRGSSIPIHAPSANHVFSVSSASSSSNANHSTSPWSRWGTVSTPSRPPSTQRRQPPASEHPPRSNGEMHSASHASSSRKRKHLEDNPPSSSSSYNRHHYRQQSDDYSRSSAKRRTIPAVSLPPPPAPAPTSPPMRPIQTLSPSLAMIMSPTNQSVQVSPRNNNLLPPIRNNSLASGSPILPPVQSLIPPGSS